MSFEGEKQMTQLMDILNELPDGYSFKTYSPTVSIIFNGEYDELGTPVFVVAYQRDGKVSLSDKGYTGYKFVDGNTDRFQEVLNRKNRENGYEARPGLTVKNIKTANDIVSMFEYLSDTSGFFIREGFQLSNRKKMLFDTAFVTDEVLPYMGNYGMLINLNEDANTYKMSVAKYKKTSVPFTEIEYELGSIKKTLDGFVYREGEKEVSEEEYQRLHPAFDRMKLVCFGSRDMTKSNVWVFANCMDSIYHLL